MAHLLSNHTGRPATFALLVSALLLTQGVATPAGDDGRVPESSRYGVVDGHMVTTPDALLRMREAGFGWVAYVLYWNVANPARDTFNWLQSDTEIDRLAGLGLNVYVRIAAPPTWTTGATYPNEAADLYCYSASEPDHLRKGDPANCENPDRRPGYRSEYPPAYDRSGDLRRFVAAAVQRYKDRVRAWGFGTEIHNRAFWQGSPEQFFDEILWPGYETVKQVDPSLVVVGPDEDDLDSFARLVGLEVTRGVRVFDALSFHLLYHTCSRTETQLGRGCDVEAPGGVIPYLDDSVRATLDRVRNGRPFWVTELGYWAYGDKAEDIAGFWLGRMLTGVAARPWIDKTFVLAIKDAGDGADFGLLNEDDTPKPAYQQVRDVIQAQAIPRAYYLAEGSTKSIFDMDIAIANPNPQPAPVKVSFLRSDGTVVLLTPTLKPMARETIRVDGVPGLADTDVSTVVESTAGLPLAVERTMFWDARAYGGHTDTAVQTPAKTWYFAEGAQGFFDTYLLLANSNIAPARVTVTFLLEGGDPLEVTREIGANTRATICACEFPPLQNQAFGIAVTADQPIIAERAMYFGSTPGRQWNGGHDSAGVTAPSTSWFLAEGRTGHFFDEYVLVSNPNEDDATVQIDFLTNTGDVVPFAPGPAGDGVIPGKSRYTIPVDSLPRLEDVAVSAKVTSDLPVVVERAMYWPGPFTEWYEAHNSFGLTQTGTRWALAEGRSGTPLRFETFILLVNTSDAPVDVRVTYLLGDTAESFTVHKSVAPNSRADVTDWDVVDALGTNRLADRAFGALIESSGPIAVERAMYWRGAGGRMWEGGSNAPGVKLQ